MNKMIFVTGIAFVFLVFTGFQNARTTIGPASNKTFPKEKNELLNKIVGRWITETNIHARKSEQASKVIGSDVWQWSPDGNFLVHTAYGIRNKSGFGAIQITGYNSKTGDFDCYNFNPDGSFSIETLTINNNIWVWKSKEVRTIGIMDESSRILTVKHEITADGKKYEFFMDGVLTKGSDF